LQHSGDGIVRKLMQLEDPVLLFDQFDEVLRERDIAPAQFGRFLTTSMLPRLAELWKARKIMYFVATNHIEYFDRAVTRSERFDAILYIGPPSMDAKQEQLRKILADRYKIQVVFDPALSRDTINGAIPRDECDAIESARTKEERDALKAAPLKPKFILSKFALLRWDELDELAKELVPVLGTKTKITEKILEEALRGIRDTKSRTLGEYYRFLSDFKYERFDVSKLAGWLVEIQGFDPTSDPPAPIERCGKHFILKDHVGSELALDLPGYRMERLPEGKIRLTKKKKRSPSQ